MVIHVYVCTFERSLRLPLPYALQRYKKGYITRKHFSIIPPSTPSHFPFYPTDIDGKESLIAERLRSLHHSSSPSTHPLNRLLFHNFPVDQRIHHYFSHFACSYPATCLPLASIFPCPSLMPNRTSWFCKLWRPNRFSIPHRSL